MKYPQMDEYHQAIQRPDIVFEDTDLRSARIETDQLGLPRVSSGGFALTYRLNGKGKAWAVRCFHKEVSDRQQRYAAISQFLQQHPQSFFVPTGYLPHGILVNGIRYPITKMAWVNGETLYRFIERNIQTNISAIKLLAPQFQTLVSELERLGIAHGDLQHGNILVANGNLILVDYDGMFVPALAGFRGEERGHVNYQHPQRNAEFQSDIDRFSTIVIYVALKAITPQLWARYSTGENLLFRQDDFRAPNNSKLLAELETVPELQPIVKRFRVICQRSLSKAPRLADFLSGNMPTTVSEPITLAARQRQYDVVDSSKREELLARVGQRVTVIGKISDYFHSDFGYSEPSKPYAFLNFGNWRKGDFRLVLWADTLDLFEQRQIDPGSFSQNWVSVTGLVTKYTNKNSRDYDNWQPVTNPQIIIESPSEIEVLRDEKEAKELLGLIDQTISVSRSTPTGNQATSKPVVTDKISELYQGWNSTPHPVTSTSPQRPPAKVVPKPTTQPKPTTRPSTPAPKPRSVSPIRPMPRSSVIRKTTKKKWWEFWK